MKLRVLARGTAMVPDIDAQENRVRRFIGRTLVRGEFYKDAEGVERQAGSFHPGTEPVEVPDLHEYVRSVKEGDLWAADLATAVRCGVVFDPNFGEPAAKKAAKSEEGSK